MKKAVSLCGLIVFLMLILPHLAGVATAEPIIIDTEKGVPGFRSEPARDLPGNWQYVHDHPDTSADGWFDTNAYPPGQGNGSFWYAISFPDMGECKGIWETSVPYTGKYEVFVWIPSPDPFDPYLDESTPPSDYLPTKRAQYKVFHNDGVATVSIDQNVNMGGFTSLGVFVFDSTARVELSSNGVEFWRCVAFDAVKVVPVVHDIAVTDVTTITTMPTVGQSTAICVTVTNEGSQQEANVSVKAFVDGARVGSTHYVSLDPGASDTTTFLWVPGAAKSYSVEAEVRVVGGETDIGDNRKAIEVLTMPAPAPIFDEIWDTTEEKSTQLTASEMYTFITKWGTYGAGDGEFNSPTDIAVDSSGNVFVVDRINNRIQKFDSDGTFITKWGTYGAGDGQFYFPTGIAVDSSGYVFVTDIRNNRIQKFDSVGNFITKWGSEGSGDGQFSAPCGIAVDSSGYVFVVDTNRIQKFDSDGTFITKWGTYGSGDGQFYLPQDVAVDSSGYVFVTDAMNNRIQKFDSVGNFITKWGFYGTGDGQFDKPNCIAVDSNGNVFVTDTSNHRIQKFDSVGNFITKWGFYGTGDGQFEYPRGIAVDSSGYVYVVDTCNRIQKFAPKQLPSAVLSTTLSDRYTAGEPVVVGVSVANTGTSPFVGIIEVTTTSGFSDTKTVAIPAAPSTYSGSFNIGRFSGGSYIATVNLSLDSSFLLDSRSKSFTVQDPAAVKIVDDNAESLKITAIAEFDEMAGIPASASSGMIADVGFNKLQKYIGDHFTTATGEVQKESSGSISDSDVQSMSEEANGTINSIRSGISGEVSGLIIQQVNEATDANLPESINIFELKESVTEEVYGRIKDAFEDIFTGVLKDYVLKPLLTDSEEIKVVQRDGEFNSYVDSTPFSLTNDEETRIRQRFNAGCGSISSVTESKALFTIGPYEIPSVGEFSYSVTLREEKNKFDQITQLGRAIKYAIGALAVIGVVFTFIVTVLGTGGAFLLPLIAAIPHIVTFLTSVVNTIIPIAKTFLIVGMLATVSLIAPEVTLQHDTTLDTIEDIIADVTTSQTCSVSISMLSPTASYINQPSSVTLLLDNNEPAHVQPITEVMVFSPDGRIIDIQRQDPYIAPHSFTGITQSLHLPSQSGTYTVLGMIHAGGVATSIAQERMTVTKPSLDINLSTDSLVYSINDTIEISANFTNNEASEIGNLTYIIEVINTSTVDANMMILAASSSQTKTLSFTPTEEGSYVAAATLLLGFSEMASETIGFTVGSGEGLVINTVAEDLYPPEADVTLPVTIENIGTVQTVSTVNITTFDELTDFSALYTDEFGVSLDAGATTTMQLCVLPNAPPGIYQTILTAGNFSAQSVSYTVTANGTLFTILDTDKLYYNLSDSVHINITTNDVLFNATNASVNVTVTCPNGTAAYLAVSGSDGNYTATFDPASNGTYQITASSQKIGFRTYDDETFVIVGIRSTLNANLPMNNLTFNQTVYFECNITNEYDVPIDNTITTLTGCGINTTTLSDGAGTVNFVITPNATGMVTLTAEKGGFADYTSKISVLNLTPSKIIYPDFTDTDTPGSWRTWLGVMNTGDANTTLNLTIYNQDGSLAYSNPDFVTLEPKAAHFFRPGITAGIAQGSTIVSGDNLAGTCHESMNDGDGAKVYTAVTSSSPTLYYPDFTDTDTIGNWRTWLGVVNAGDTSTTLNLTVYSPDGSLAYSNANFVTLEPKAAHFFRPGITAGIAQGCVVVSGANLAGTCHVNKNGGEGTKVYTALTSGSSTHYYPDFTDTDTSGNWRTWLGVMNTGDASTTLNLTIYNPDGSLAYSNANFITLEPKAAHFFRPGITAGIAQGDVVVSGDNLAGTCHVNKNGGVSTKVYTALASGSSTLNYPDFTDTDIPGNWRTWMGVMNTGATSTTVRLDVYNADGSLAYSNPNFVTLEPKATHFFRPGITAGIAQGDVVVSGDNLAGTCHVNKNGGVGTKVYTAIGG